MPVIPWLAGLIESNVCLSDLCIDGQSTSQVRCVLGEMGWEVVDES